MAVVRLDLQCVGRTILEANKKNQRRLFLALNIGSRTKERQAISEVPGNSKACHLFIYCKSSGQGHIFSMGPSFIHTAPAAIEAEGNIFCMMNRHLYRCI